MNKPPKRAASATPPAHLLADIRSLVEATRQHVAQTANATLTMLYWHVGQRIQREVLKDQRAGYGERIVSTLSTQLVREYGKGFAEKGLRRMVQFAEVFPDEQIVATIELEPLRRNPAAQATAGARVLCRDVPGGALERPRPA